jgi:hypothetical protein
MQGTRTAEPVLCYRACHDPVMCVGAIHSNQEINQLQSINAGIGGTVEPSICSAFVVVL